MPELLLFTRETLEEWKQSPNGKKMETLDSFVTWLNQRTEHKVIQTLELETGESETITCFPQLDEAFVGNGMDVFKHRLEDSIQKLREVYATLSDRTFDEVEVANKAFQEVIEQCIPTDVWVEIMRKFEIFLKDEEPPPLLRAETRLTREKNTWRAEEKLLKLTHYRALSVIPGYSYFAGQGNAVAATTPSSSHNGLWGFGRDVKNQGPTVRDDTPTKPTIASKANMRGGAFYELVQAERDSYNPFTYFSRYARDIQDGQVSMKEVADTLATIRDADSEDYAKFKEAHKDFTRGVKLTPTSAQVERKYSTEETEMVKKELLALQKSTEHVRTIMQGFLQFEQRNTIEKIDNDLRFDYTVDDKAVASMSEYGNNRERLNRLKDRVEQGRIREEQQLDRILNKSWVEKLAIMEEMSYVPIVHPLRFNSNNAKYHAARRVITEIRAGRRIRNTMKKHKPRI